MRMTISRSRGLVDPELLPMLVAYPPLVLSDATLPELRNGSRLLLPPFEHPERVERSERMAAATGAPDVPLFVYRPFDRQGMLPCIYHIHGGGYVGGAAAPLDPIHRAMADDLGCVIVSVEYRLAPETPYPGPIEDCYTGLSWLFDCATEIGVDPTRIGLMGESAGAGLAAGLALLTRDRGKLDLAFQHLIYPMLDDRTCVDDDPHPYAGEYIWTLHNNHYGWRAYLGSEPGSANVSFYASPARAVNLSGLPPTFICTGALDLFLEEDVDFALRLTRAGVPVELHVYPGGFHGFIFHPTADVAQRATCDSWEALRRRLHPAGQPGKTALMATSPDSRS